MPNILDWGSEDSDFSGIGSVSVDTTAGHFTTNLACGLAVATADGPLPNYWRSINRFLASSFWLTAKVWSNAASVGFAFWGLGGTDAFLLRLLDTNAVPRIAIVQFSRPGAQNLAINGPLCVAKVDSLGNFTQIGAEFTGPANSTLQQITVRVNYSTFGSIQIYIGSNNTATLVYQFFGDVTTEGVTQLAGFDLGEPNPKLGTGNCVWSDVICSDFDNRSMELYKLVITGAGATSAWNGASDGSTIDEITLNATNGIDSDTATQVELFTQPGSLPTGTFQILGIGINAFSSAAIGGTPQHIETALRISGTNYFSPDLSPAVSLGRVSYLWQVSPATSVDFSAAEVATMQIGVKSTA